LNTSIGFQANADELHANLKVREFDALLLHGDMDQIERNKVISAFRKKECPILVATDVAGKVIRLTLRQNTSKYSVLIVFLF